MDTWLKAGFAVFFWCAGIWFFQDTISENMTDRQLLEKYIYEHTVITMGVEEPCITRINLSVWEDMNKLSLYRWTTACEAQHD